MPNTLRARLLVLMMTVLLPALAAALVVVARTYGTAREAVERNQRDTARAVSQVVDRELARRADIAHAMATSRLLTEAQGKHGPDPKNFHEWATRGSRTWGDGSSCTRPRSC